MNVEPGSHPRLGLAAAVCLASLTAQPAITEQNYQGQPIRGLGSTLLTSSAPSDLGIFGSAIASGDLNGDGVADLIIGEPNGVATSGRAGGLVHILTGSPTGLQSSIVLQPTQEGSLLGFALAVADFDGDGIDELVASAPTSDVNPFLDLGAGLLHYYDHVDGSRVEFSQDNAAGASSESSDEFGSVLAVGNFDGDAYQDLAVGVPSEDADSPTVLFDTGAVIIFYGGPNGLPGVRTVVLDESDGMRGFQEFQRFGRSLAAGDLNGDGYDELIIGSPQRDDSGFTDSGAVYALNGSPTGLAPTQSPGTWNFFVGNANEGRFGEAIAVGDFDFTLQCIFSDCFDDLAIGWPGWDDPLAPGSNHGAVFLLEGSANGIAANPGILLQRPDLAPDAQWQRSSERFGARLTAGALDQNIGPDLAIQLPESRFGQGRLMVAPGASDGLGAKPSILLHNGIANPPTQGPSTWFGWTVTAADFNADGTIDLAVGAPTDQVGDLDAGTVEVMYSGCLLCDGFETGDTQSWNESR